MKIEIPIDSEVRRLVHDDPQTCSFCRERAHIVAREFDHTDKNVGNIYFCWNHWGDYMTQEFPDYFVKGAEEEQY